MGRVLNKSVAIDIPIVVHPLKSGLNIRPKVLDESLISRPLVVLASEHYEQRRGIDATVVTCKRNLSQIRHLAMSQLVKNFPRFCFARLVNLGSLRFSQKFQNPLRDRRIDPQSLERGDDAVAAEHCAEPRNAGVWIVPLTVANG